MPPENQAMNKSWMLTFLCFVSDLSFTFGRQNFLEEFFLIVGISRSSKWVVFQLKQRISDGSNVHSKSEKHLRKVRGLADSLAGNGSLGHPAHLTLRPPGNIMKRTSPETSPETHQQGCVKHICTMQTGPLWTLFSFEQQMSLFWNWCRLQANSQCQIGDACARNCTDWMDMQSRAIFRSIWVSCSHPEYRRVCLILTYVLT